MSGVTDCYQPVERQLALTRKCLEVLLEFRNPAGVITKNHLVTRDIDLLAQLASLSAAVVMVSVTTLDPELSARMEPRTSAPARRLAAIEAIARAGIPAGVMVAPVIPGLTDHEMPSILKAAAEAGAMTCGYVPVRLPFAVAPLFEQWLSRHYPDRKDKVLNRIRDLRGGKLNDSNFHSRMRGQGVFADQIANMFQLARRKAGLDRPFRTLSTSSFRVPGGAACAVLKAGREALACALRCGTPPLGCVPPKGRAEESSTRQPSSFARAAEFSLPFENFITTAATPGLRVPAC